MTKLALRFLRPPAPRASRPVPDSHPLPGAGFHPTPLQRRFFDRIGEGDSIDDACEAIGVARSTFYLWRRHTGFRAWLAAAVLRESILDGWELLVIARDQSEDSFRHWKAAYDFTFNPATRQKLLAWAQWCAAQDCPSSVPEVLAPSALPPSSENV